MNDGKISLIIVTLIFLIPSFVSCSGNSRETPAAHEARKGDAAAADLEEISPERMKGFYGVYSFGKDDEILDIQATGSSPALVFYSVAGNTVTEKEKVPIHALALHKDMHHTLMKPFNTMASGRLKINNDEYHVFFLARNFDSLIKRIEQLSRNVVYDGFEYDRDIGTFLRLEIPASIKESIAGKNICEKPATFQDIIRTTGSYRCAEFRFLYYAGTHDEFKDPLKTKLYRKELYVNVVLPMYNRGFFFTFTSEDAELTKMINKQMQDNSDMVMKQINARDGGLYLHFYSLYLPETDIFTFIALLSGKTLYLDHWNRDSGYSAIRAIFTRI
ncbi:MAG: hypothetical protein JXD23_05390 [Spirochaetales bacterium]|nr:hypothetical protein [Spirochaetales bacterium]